MIKIEINDASLELTAWEKTNIFKYKLAILTTLYKSVKPLFFVLFLVFCFCCLGLSGCRSSPETAPDELVIGIESAPLTLDPRLATDAYSTKISRLIYSGLFKWNDHFQLEPDLAESYQWITSTHLKIRLKKEVSFHNGEPLTAEDVVKTYQSIMQNQVTSPYKTSFEKVQSIQTTGVGAIEIRLQMPFAPFLSNLTLGILPQGRYQDQPQGTGPFILKRFDADEKVVLIRNPYYFRNPALLRQITFRVVKDDNLRVLELLHGRVDLVQNGIPAGLIDYVSRQNTVIVKQEPGINFAYLGFNLKSEPLSHNTVRQAMAHAINIPEILIN
jgi:peptide/nickel transport system substrate-binding protein